jgi:DNA-binding NarL/FixJ family response regulator
VLARHTINWVLIDWSMPGLSGAEAIELIRVTNPNIPIVVMSGYTANEIMSQTNPPPAGFLHKPFRADELAQLVNQFAQIRT